MRSCQYQKIQIFQFEMYGALSSYLQRQAFSMHLLVKALLQRELLCTQRYLTALQSHYFQL